MANKADILQVLNDDSTSITMSQTIYPPAGTYFVEAASPVYGVSRKDPDKPVAWARLPWTVVAVEGQPDSKLAKTEGSSFFWMDKSKAPGSMSPAEMVGRALYRLHSGEFPADGLNISDDGLIELVDDCEAKKFVIVRSLRKAKNGSYREKDLLLSSKEYQAKIERDAETAEPEDHIANVEAAQTASAS